MHKKVTFAPVRRPRNGVVRALIARIRAGSGRHARAGDKRKQAADNADLAHRVRDVGEW